eukprot:5449031-Heterocapsa_arctica.AAC.1
MAASSAVWTEDFSWPYLCGMRAETALETLSVSTKYRESRPNALACAANVAPEAGAKPPSPKSATSEPGAGSGRVPSKNRLRRSARGDHGSDHAASSQSSGKDSPPLAENMP